MAFDNLLTTPGRFVVGCNYWASHAGTMMWRDWRPEVVETDFQRLSAAGLQVLRVFPLWPDFQPLTQLYGGGGHRVEFRHGEEPLPDDRLGQAGLSAVAMERFGVFCDLAAKYDLHLLVGLITGWMSGRLHLPPGLEGRNPLTDPVAIEWELRFVREFVGRFREHSAVVAWDLGNECNCMGPANREQASTWTAMISNTIRAADPTRPVVSGLHGLSPTGNWTMADQSEWTDLLCTHPYPVFTPHCDQDPVNTMRTILHSTAESRYYADLGGQPCLCQEIGTLGPVIASERVAADFIRSCLYSLWANDAHGLIWWCANEQTELAHAPYDWHAVERELGLLRVDGTPKPVLDELTAFRRLLDSLPFEALPPRRREAVCILTDAQDHWAVAYSTYVLAKQAGFDLEFQYETQPLRDAELYLLPCLSGHRMISRRRWQELMARVEAGATLYASLDSGLPSGFEPAFGLEPQTRERRREFGQIRLDSLPGAPEIPCAGTFKVRLEPTRAEVLAREADGNPAFTVAPYGRGRVYYLGVPLELNLTRTPGAFHAPDAPACWRLYAHLAAPLVASRAVTKSAPCLAVTEHALSDDERVIIAGNLSPATLTETLDLGAGWSVATVWHGQATPHGEVTLAANEAAVFSVRR